MSALNDLRAVLCDPDGHCCLSGCAEDRAIVDHSLLALDAVVAALKTAQWMLARDYIDDQKMAVIDKCRAALESAEEES